MGKKESERHTKSDFGKAENFLCMITSAADEWQQEEDKGSDHVINCFKPAKKGEVEELLKVSKIFSRLQTH